MIGILTEKVIRLAGMALRLTGREYETDLRPMRLVGISTGQGGKALRLAEMTLRLNIGSKDNTRQN